MRRLVRLLAAAAVTLGALGCGRAAGPPIRLGLGRSALPGPGLCLILGGGAGQRARSCDGIEHAAPLGSRVLYRPDDGSRRGVVCYMSPEAHGVIIGIDVFDLNTGRIVEVIQRYGEAPPAPDCATAYAVGPLMP